MTCCFKFAWNNRKSIPLFKISNFQNRNVWINETHSHFHTSFISTTKTYLKPTKTSNFPCLDDVFFLQWSTNVTSPDENHRYYYYYRFPSHQRNVLEGHIPSNSCAKTSYAFHGNADRALLVPWSRPIHSSEGSVGQLQLSAQQQGVVV